MAARSAAASNPFLPRTLKRLDVFVGGLNNRFAANLIEDNELSDVSNMVYDERGTLQKRKGIVPRYSSNFATGKIRGLYGYYKENGQSFLMMSADDKIFYDSAQFRRSWSLKSEWEEDGSTRIQVSTTITPNSITLVLGSAFFDESLGLFNLGLGILGGSSTYGYWISAPIDVSQVVTWASGLVTIVGTIPANTAVNIATRTSADQVTWSAWTALSGSSVASAQNSFIQVRLQLISNNGIAIPSVQSALLTFDVNTAPTTLKTGMSTTARYSWATQNDNLYIVNGSDAPLKWTGSGSTVAHPGTPPTAKYVLVVKSRMYMAGAASPNRSRLYFSVVGDPETWNALDFIDVGKGEGDFITGLWFFLDSIIIFKNRSIWLLQGDSSTNFVLRKVSDAYGAADGHGAAIFGGSTPQASGETGAFAGMYRNVLFFPAVDGIRSYDGIKNSLISLKINGTYTALNIGQLVQVSGYWFRNRYYCSVPKGSILHNNQVLVYDTIYDAWTVFDNLNVSEMVSFIEYNVATLIFGDSTQGMVYNADTGYNDAGAAIDCYGATKALSFDGMDRLKLGRTVFITCREPSQSSTSMEVRFVPNLGALSSPLTLALPTGSFQNVLRAIPSAVTNPQFRSLAIRVRNNELNKGFSVHEIVLDYVQKGERQTS